MRAGEEKIRNRRVLKCDTFPLKFFFYVCFLHEPTIFYLIKQYSPFGEIRWASHCFPTEKAGTQDFTHMIARPSFNKDIEIRKQCEARFRSV